VVVGATMHAAAGVDEHAHASADSADQHCHRGRRDGSVLRVPRADRLRSGTRRQRLRFRGHRIVRQRGVFDAGRTGGIPHRAGQWTLHRPFRSPAGARRWHRHRHCRVRPAGIPRPGRSSEPAS
jgi:hypothetical protein